MKKQIDNFIKSLQFNTLDKDELKSMYTMYSLIRTQSMFNYTNLPDTIPQSFLELYLQCNGNCIIAKVNNALYALTGGLGGEPNPYYFPTKYTVANPALKLSNVYTIDKDCILIPNDSLYVGLLPLILKYSSQLSENDITLTIADINARITSLISASDDKTYKSALEYINQIQNGKLGIISENALLDGIKSQPYSTTASNQITNLIEYHQYLKASLFNDLGLNANYNMKRESINSGESQLNNDALFPLIDDMLNNRKKAIQKVNDMFGTDITVDLSSSWKDNKTELKLEQTNLDKDGDTENENEANIPESE